MITWRRHSDRAIAAAAAVLLQAAVYLTLSQRHPSVRIATTAPTLFAMILAASRPKREAPPARHPSERRQPKLVAEHPVARPISPSESQKHASRSAFDWGRAIQQEVRKGMRRAVVPPKIRFGFPAMPAAQGPPREWDGWDEVRVDRVKRLEQGIIDLGDNCFIELTFPIPQCHFEPPQGDLFKHMHERRDEVPGSLP